MEKCILNLQELIGVKDENKRLTDENIRLRSRINELKAQLEETNITIKSGPKVCGCVEIEGTRTSTAYQDIVGLLLYENYTVQLRPLDDRKRLKITIYEREV